MSLKKTGIEKKRARKTEREEKKKRANFIKKRELTSSRTFCLLQTLRIVGYLERI